jgi:hypothetical protein
MAAYVLKICHRPHPDRTAGWVTKIVEFEAADHASARAAALAEVRDVKWGGHFVTIDGDNGQFVEIWETAPNA